MAEAPAVAEAKKAEAEAPMVAEAKKVEEVEAVENKGPGHYQIEHPYVCIGEPRVEYVPTPTPSSSSTVVVIEITWKRVLQYVTTINGTSTLDRRGPVETLGSSSSSFDAAALLAASPATYKTANSAGDAWFDVVASFPAAAHLAPFLPAPSSTPSPSTSTRPSPSDRPRTRTRTSPSPPPSSTSRSSPSSTRASTTTGSSPSAISSARSARRRGSPAPGAARATCCTAGSWIS
uniref:Uncharacterized protein n=1 Tax=Ananas comosus var. bracteatus TaxID=296719 RepID=A0A6V7P1I2_ANACO|nr:unnamed protein product [Ananas comosus var. bracteatus]